MTHGSISIDGIDIRDLDPSWLRGRAIGFINQVSEDVFVAMFISLTYLILISPEAEIIVMVCWT